MLFFFDICILFIDLLFTMLLLIMVFELIVIFYGKYFLNNILKINIAILNNLVTMASEIVMFYLLICIIYMYLPPKKMKFNLDYITEFSI